MKYNIVELSDVFNKINKREALAFDTETKGKYGKICLAQFYQQSWNDEVLLVRFPNIYELMVFFNNLSDVHVIMQKANYDITTIQRQLDGYFTMETFDDTLLLSRIAFPALDKYSLDYLFTYVLGYDPYAKLDIDKAVMQKFDWSKPLGDKELQYAAIDAYHLIDLYERCKSAKESFSYKLDMISLREALEFQRNGMCVDIDRLEVMFGNNLARVKEIDVPINVNSYKQVRPYIGSNESDQLGLTLLSLQGNTRAGAVNEARKLIKLNSFLTKFNTPDAMIYGIFGPYARSGRYTCEEQNLQQLPRKSKSLFKAKEGRYMLYSDFSQLELRSIAAITGDSMMCQVYKDYGDIHNLVSEMLGISRQISKTINFNGLYGGGAGMMQKILIKDAELLLPIGEVATALKKWKNLFKTVAAWQDKGIRDYHAGRLGSTVCGRQYRGNLMTDQLNIENSGTGAEVAKLAMHYMYSDLKANDTYIQNFIHDSFILDTPIDAQTTCIVSQRVAEAMKEAWHEVTQNCKVKDIPMPVTVYGGYNWGDIEEGKYDYKYAA